jgi:NAD(P)-dependent dehydrogenase (short-subunit alcohol dehydrogenase family)
MVSAEARAREAVPPDLAGRVALVLGAGAVAPGWGIGKAIACRFAAAGATVIAADREIAAAEVAAAEIVEAVGGAVEPAAVDVLDETALAARVAEVEARHGRIDVLHCNVGLGKAGPGAETSAVEFRRFAEANLVSVHVAAQAALPGMRARRSGVVLATSTVAALRHPGYQHLAYGATKAALNHYMAMLAVEVAPDGVRANAVVAGLIDTPRIARTLAGAYGEDMRARRAAQVPLGRMGDPFDVADAALFLASDRAAYVTGQTLTVDGGLTATVRGG